MKAASADRRTIAVNAPAETSQETETYPTLEAVAEQRRAQMKTQPPSKASTITETTTTAPDAEGALPGSPEGLEQEAGQEGAFNEETGEINWGCPCLGGMATGPCGEQFKAAFSCFVYSKEEPKGVECIEHFKTMQNCFREHPDVYGSELDDDEAPPPEMPDTQESPVESRPAPPSASEPTPSQSTESEPAAMPSLANMDSSSTHGHGEKVADYANAPGADRDGKRERAQAATKQVQQDHGPRSETEHAVPKAAHDAR
ncbi:hypothetical protein LTR08_004972 [Meristemomyces frigidus]|nr:hypothetical protein LTR08_004972 [Meristemomyces frigidus]